MADSSSGEKRKASAADDTFASKRQRIFEGMILTLLPAYSHKGVRVHEALLKDNSVYLKKYFEQGGRTSVHVPFESEVVLVYVEYLYSQTIKVDKKDNNEPDFSLLARLYCFGERYQDNDFCNMILSALYAESHAAGILPGDECVSTIYRDTSYDYPLRGFIVHAYAKCLVPDNQDSWIDYPRQFLQDLVIEVCERRTASSIDFEAEKEKWMKPPTKKQ